MKARHVAIFQVDTANIMKIDLGEKASVHFNPVLNTNCSLVVSPPTSGTVIGGCPSVTTFDMPSEQFCYANHVKHG